MEEPKKIKIPEDLLKSLKSRYDEAYSMNQRFVRILYQAASLCAPLSEGLNVLYGYNDTGKNENRRIFNSTPKYFSNARANKLHSLLMPINKRWGYVHSDTEDGEDVPQEEYTNKIFDYIDKSNLHSVAKSFFLDLNIGCAALRIKTPKKGSIIFENVAGITLMPEYSDEPCHSNVWYKRTVNWQELYRLSPEKANSVSSSTTGRDGVGNEYHITCGYIDLRDDPRVGGFLNIQFYEDEFDEPVFAEVDPFKRLILVNETLRAGESRGHGIILQILEDIERLNNLTDSLDRYIRYTAEPALLTPDQLPSPLTDLQGAMLPSELAQDGKPVIQPVTWQLPVEWVYTWIQYYEKKIEKYFNVMPLGMSEDDPRATATEVNYLKATEERQTVADMSRVANETLGGIMKAVFDVMIYWKEIDVKESDVFNFKFDSPEVDIQSQENINAVLQLSELNTQINGQGSGPMYMNPERTYAYLAQNLKTPSAINNTQEEVERIQQNMQQQVQQASNAQEGAQQAANTPSPLQPAQAISPTQLGQQTRIGGVGI